MVRCHRKRFIGASVAVPTDWPGIDLRDSLRITLGSRVGVVEEFTSERGPLGPYQCSNHNDGHRVDGQLLRDAIDELRPPAKPPGRGKVPSIISAPSSLTSHPPRNPLNFR